MKYDVEGDWLIFRTCNYRCDYCFLSAEALGEKVKIHASPDQWRTAFDRTGKTWLLHLTGGEPTHYPDFLELSEQITRRHFMSINSNLTGAAALRFAERIDPARISFINAGLHPAERARRGGHAVFLKHAEALLKRGFPVMVSVVATPEVLRRFDEVVASLRPIGLMPFPKMMQGTQNGRLYPDSYTEKERSLFRRHSLAAERSYPSLFGRNPFGGNLFAAQLLGIDRGRPSIDPTLGRKHLAKSPVYLGQMCTAGQDFVMIRPDGGVRRCGSGPSMGNILDGTVKFASKAKPCDRAHCFYFCEKFTARAAAQRTRRKPIATIAAGIKRRLAGAVTG